MRRIKCSARFRPFSHLPGMIFPVPYSEYGVEIFPTALRILPSNQWVSLPVEGPVRDFSAMLDLERGGIKIFGSGKSRFCFWVNADQTDIAIQEKAPLHPPPQERLSLGISKKPDWELVRRRSLLAEVLPFWFFLGQMMPEAKRMKGDSLLDDLEEAIAEKDLLKTQNLLESVWKTGFRGVLFPQSDDTQHLGYPKPPIPKGSSPLSLLSSGYRMIKSLLVSSDQIAPLATGLFPFGSTIGLSTSFGTIDLEWTKHRLRRLHILSTSDCSQTLQFPKPLHKCRLMVNQSEYAIALKPHAVLDLQKNTQYFLDHFE